MPGEVFFPSMELNNKTRNDLLNEVVISMDGTYYWLNVRMNNLCAFVSVGNGNCEILSVTFSW